MGGKAILTNPFIEYYNDVNDYESICRKFILASILYYRKDISPVTDSRFDNWCFTLNMKYKDAPEWFRNRVTRADLVAGTGFAAVPTETELQLCDDFVSGKYDINLF